MDVKFGFFVEMITGFGLYDPNEFRQAKIVEWKIKAGDIVKKGDLIASIETDKAEVEIESFIAGIVVALNYEEGETWNSGGIETTSFGDLILPELGIIRTESVPEIRKSHEIKPYEVQPRKIEKSKEEPNEVYEVEPRKIGEAEESKVKLPNISPVAKKMAVENNFSLEDLFNFYPGVKRIEREHVEKFMEAQKQEKDIFQKILDKPRVPIKALPAARKRAEELGINIAEVKGSGQDGLIKIEDVESVAVERYNKTSDYISKKLDAPELDNTIILTPLRRQALVRNLESKSEDAVSSSDIILDFKSLVELRKHYGDDFEKVYGVQFRIWAPVALAAVRMLNTKDFLLLNGYWIVNKGDRNQDKAAIYKSVNLGIAYDLGMLPKIDIEKGTVSYNNGLRILTLHDAQNYNMRDFFQALDTLLNNAHFDSMEGKLKKTTLRDWSGWGFIFNNVGAMGGLRGNSLLTPKISAEFNLGSINELGRAFFQIFFDHRMVDGSHATKFLYAVHKEMMENVIPEIVDSLY